MVPTIKSLFSIVIVGCITVNAFSIHSVSKRQAETNGDTIEIFPVTIQEDAQSIDEAFENESEVYEIYEPESIPTGSQEEIDEQIFENEDIIVDSEELKSLEELDQEIILEKVDSDLQIDQQQEIIESEETILDEVADQNGFKIIEQIENPVENVLDQTEDINIQDELSQPIQVDEMIQESIEEQTDITGLTSDESSISEIQPELSVNVMDSANSQEVIEEIQESLQELSDDSEEIPIEDFKNDETTDENLIIEEASQTVKEDTSEEEPSESLGLNESPLDTQPVALEEQESELVEQQTVSEIQEEIAETAEEAIQEQPSVDAIELLDPVIPEETGTEEEPLESLELIETPLDTQPVASEQQESELVEQQTVSETQEEISETAEEAIQEITSEDLDNEITEQLISEAIDNAVETTETTEKELTLDEPFKSLDAIELPDPVIPEETETEVSVQPLTEESTEENVSVAFPNTPEEIIQETTHEEIQDQQVSSESENLVLEEQIIENDEDIMVISDELKELEELDQDKILEQVDSEVQTVQVDESAENILDDLTTQVAAETVDELEIISSDQLQAIEIPVQLSETTQEEIIPETADEQLQTDQQFTQELPQDVIEDETYHFLEDAEMITANEELSDEAVASEAHAEITNIISESINNLLDSTASLQISDNLKEEITNHVIPLTEVQNNIAEPETVQQLQHHTPDQMTFDFLANADSVHFDTSMPRHPIRSFTLTIPNFDCNERGLPNLQLIEDRLTNKFIDLGLLSATQDIFTVSDAQCGSLIITFEVIEPQEVDAKELIEANLTQAVRAIVNDSSYEHEAFLSEYQPSTINKMAFGLESKIKLVKLLIMEAMSSKNIGDALTLMYLQDRYEKGIDGQKEEMLLVMFLLNKKY